MEFGVRIPSMMQGPIKNQIGARYSSCCLVLPTDAQFLVVLGAWCPAGMSSAWYGFPVLTGAWYCLMQSGAWCCLLPPGAQCPERMQGARQCPVVPAAL